MYSSRPLFFFPLPISEYEWVAEWKHTSTGLKKLYVPSLKLLFFHKLMLHSIFPLLLCSPCNDSNPITFLSAQLPRPYCPTSTISAFLLAHNISVSSLWSLYFAFLSSFFFPFLSSLPLRSSHPPLQPPDCSSTLRLSDKGKVLLKSAWLHPHLQTIEFSFWALAFLIGPEWRGRSLCVCDLFGFLRIIIPYLAQLCGIVGGGTCLVTAAAGPRQILQNLYPVLSFFSSPLIHFCSHSLRFSVRPFLVISLTFFVFRFRWSLFCLFFPFAASLHAHISFDKNATISYCTLD